MPGSTSPFGIKTPIHHQGCHLVVRNLTSSKLLCWCNRLCSAGFVSLGGDGSSRCPAATSYLMLGFQGKRMPPGQSQNAFWRLFVGPRFAAGLEVWLEL